MLIKAIGFGLLAAISSANDAITVTCNKDNTIDVKIKYDKKAEVLDFSYGDCDKAESRANFTQNSDNGWDFQLDVSACGMDNKLRNLQYNQTAKMRVGRTSSGTELTMATFDIDSYCTYTASYTVKFDYGDVTTEAHTYKSDAGLIDLEFALKSFHANYSGETASPTQAGEKIYLALWIKNKGFNHAADIFHSKDGKVFAPKSCEVTDANSQRYTLFDHSNGCKNADVDFSISFDQDTNQWRFSHILFLIGNHRTSQLNLECDVVVCDKKDSVACDAVVKSCIEVDGKWGEWDVSGDCQVDDLTKACEATYYAPVQGKQKKERKCTVGVGSNAACTGNATATQACNKDCPCPNVEMTDYWGNKDNCWQFGMDQSDCDQPVEDYASMKGIRKMTGVENVFRTGKQMKHMCPGTCKRLNVRTVEYEHCSLDNYPAETSDKSFNTCADVGLIQARFWSVTEGQIIDANVTCENIIGVSVAAGTTTTLTTTESLGFSMCSLEFSNARYLFGDSTAQLWKQTGTEVISMMDPFGTPQVNFVCPLTCHRLGYKEDDLICQLPE